jgi:hypothetical protein
MKLESTKLIHYLPYDLDIMVGNVKKKMILHDRYSNNYQICFTKVIELKYALPILRPLSDFNYKDVYGYPNKTMFYEDVKNQTIMVKIWNELLIEHIDVFGLIPAGLAININTLNK